MKTTCGSCSRDCSGSRPSGARRASQPSRSVRWPDGREVAAIGEVEGEIVEEARGGEGFGYDPVFRPAEGDGRTFAEMTPAEKHAVSHRGRAFRTLADGLRVVDALEGQQ